jgi:hypothetical protein
MLFNVPNRMFVDNHFQTFKNIVNYLSFADLTKFVMADGSNASLFDNADYSISDAKNFIKKIIYVYKHFNEVFIQK